MSEWQPIETVPTDQMVLIYIPEPDGPVILIAERHKNGWWHRPWVYDDSDLGPDYLPSYWQPLPAPPSLPLHGEDE